MVDENIEQPEGEQPEGEQPEGEQIPVEQPEGEQPEGQQQQQEKKPSIEDVIGAALEEASGKAPAKKEVVEEQPDDEFDADKHQQGPKGELLRDAKTGRFLPKEAKQGESESEADGSEKKPEKKKADGKDEDLDGPPEKEWSERTQKRFAKLSTRVRDAEGRAEESNQLFQRIASTGVSPEQFGQTMTFLRLFHSKTRADNMTAFEFLKREVEGMALKLGINDPMVDVLRGHDDLKAKVTAGQLSATDARELAINRNKAKNEAEANAQRQQEQQQTEQFTAAKKSAVSSLDKLGTQLLASDPEYPAKFAILSEALKPVFAQLHPSKWLDTFKQAYTAVKVAKPASGQQQQQRQQPNGQQKSKQQPMRPKQPSGEGKKQAKSVDDAIGMALEEYGRR